MSWDKFVLCVLAIALYVSGYSYGLADWVDTGDGKIVKLCSKAAFCAALVCLLLIYT